jgi:phage gp29-like protein
MEELLMYNNLIEFASRSLTQYLTREIATGNSLRAWGNLYTTLPNPDPVLRKTGQSISILDEIRRENHVASCSESREAAVTKKKWAIERVDATPRAAETVEAVFKELPIRHIIRELCEAWGYGYQISEIIWRREGSLLLPERVLGCLRHRFSFGKDGALRLLKSLGDMTGEPVPPYKFLLTQHRASRENPYGESKYSSCFWPVTFKKGGLKFWAVFLEKFGMPQLIGKTPRGASDDERGILLQSLVSMVRDAVAVIPDDNSVEPLQVNVTGSSDVYAQFTAYHDSEISTAILGHSAAATSTPGKLGGEDLALQVRADIVDNDVGMVEDAMNTLIKYIHELNPSLGDERPRFILYDTKDIDKPRAERDALLLNTGKIRLTKKYFVDKYDFSEDEIEIVEDTFGMPAGVDFSVHKPVQPHGGVTGAEPLSPKKDFDFQDAIDTLTEKLPDDTLQTQAEELLKPVLEAVNNAESFDDVIAATENLYNSIDDDAIQKSIEKAILLGEVWGKISGERATL